MEKMIEEMAKDIHEATRRASAILVEETRAFVKENHHYHSKNDFDKAHTKTLAELEAEYLTEKGYTKQEWISVDERLPINDYEKHWKDRNYYLVYTEPSGLMYVATFGFKEYDWWISNPEREIEQVTHYMPLPQPPKMKGAE